MKKALLLTLALAMTFGLGFAFKTVTSNPFKYNSAMGKVTGIGGIFFKCKDPNKIREWYKTHLGMDTNPYGATFEWYEAADSTKKGQTQWSPFPATTKYFDPSIKDFMINYRVENLDALVEQLKIQGVTIVDSIENSDYGKFIHILDAEGNKVQLWEPAEE